MEAGEQWRSRGSLNFRIENVGSVGGSVSKSSFENRWKFELLEVFTRRTGCSARFEESCFPRLEFRATRTRFEYGTGSSTFRNAFPCRRAPRTAISNFFFTIRQGRKQPCGGSRGGRRYSKWSLALFSDDDFPKKKSSSGSSLTNCATGATYLLFTT